MSNAASDGEGSGDDIVVIVIDVVVCFPKHRSRKWYARRGLVLCTANALTKVFCRTVRWLGSWSSGGGGDDEGCKVDEDDDNGGCDVADDGGVWANKRSSSPASTNLQWWWRGTPCGSTRTRKRTTWGGIRCWYQSYANHVYDIIGIPMLFHEGRIQPFKHFNTADTIIKTVIDMTMLRKESHSGLVQLTMK